jgi:hypothetical protein
VYGCVMVLTLGLAIARHKSRAAHGSRDLERISISGE